METEVFEKDVNVLARDNTGESTKIAAATLPTATPVQVESLGVTAVSADATEGERGWTQRTGRGGGARKCHRATRSLPQDRSHTIRGDIKTPGQTKNTQVV